MKMTFGKYQGVPLSEIPDGYLLWVLDNIKSLSPTLRSAIRVRLGLDEAARPDPGTADPFESYFERKERDRRELEPTIKAWFRQLVLDYHPDRRGSHDAMLALNDAHARLRKALDLTSR
jgi:hypothetical protein